MTTGKPLIRLWELNSLGVIVKCESGVVFTNQVCGYANYHLEMEGVFVPLQDETVDLQTMLYEYFTGPKWGGYCYYGIDEETADFLDNAFPRSTSTSILKVNRDLLDKSGEAWVHVFIDQPHHDRYPLIDGFPGNEGIATWGNSD